MSFLKTTVARATPPAPLKRNWFYLRHLQTLYKTGNDINLLLPRKRTASFEFDSDRFRYSRELLALYFSLASFIIISPSLSASDFAYVGVRVPVEQRRQKKFNLESVCVLMT